MGRRGQKCPLLYGMRCGTLRTSETFLSVPLLFTFWIQEEGEWVESLIEDGTSEDWEPQRSFCLGERLEIV